METTIDRKDDVKFWELVEKNHYQKKAIWKIEEILLDLKKNYKACDEEISKMKEEIKKRKDVEFKG